MNANSLIVIDTNVLVSALLSPFDAPGRITELVVAGTIQVALDDRILLEYHSVLRRPKFNFLPALVDELLTSIENEAYAVVASPVSVSLPDPDDLPFVEVAISARALLITGNLRHFPTNLHPDFSVFAPQEFLARLKSPG